jgi:hypothetical protein
LADFCAGPILVHGGTLDEGDLMHTGCCSTKLPSYQDQWTLLDPQR